MTGVAGSSSAGATPGPSARPWRSPPAEIAPGVFHSAISGVNVYFGLLCPIRGHSEQLKGKQRQLVATFSLRSAT
jgi:hypothetical protein